MIALAHNVSELTKSLLDGVTEKKKKKKKKSSVFLLSVYKTARKGHEKRRIRGRKKSMRERERELMS